jgi:hypothetical protein
MFISSYSTYVGTTASDKIDRRGVEYSKDDSEFFKSKLSQNQIEQTNIVKNLPIDYISNYKSFNNQQKLQEQTLSQSEMKFTQIKAMKSAKEAYEDNSKMFSLLRKPHVSLNQTPSIDEELPQDIQELKEKNLRHVMVNTYLANDKYYQITA